MIHVGKYQIFSICIIVFFAWGEFIVFRSSGQLSTEIDRLESEQLRLWLIWSQQVSVTSFRIWG